MLKWLNNIEEIIVVISLALMSVIAFGNVLTRNIFDISLAFTEEVTVNLFVLLTFVGASIGVRKNAHLGFSLLFDKASFRVKRLMLLIVGCISIVVFSLFTYYGLEMVLFQMNMESTTPALGWPRWIFSIGLPIGTLLCLIRSIQVILNEWKQTSTVELQREGT